MNFGFDIDGVIDAFPRECQSLMSALTNAGHQCIVLTGTQGDSVPKSVVIAKRQYLTSLGITKDCYSKLIVCPAPHPENKAQAVLDNSIAVLFDNKKGTCKQVAPLAACFLLWNARED